MELRPRRKKDKSQEAAPLPTKHLCTINAIQDQSVVDNLQGNRKAPPESSWQEAAPLPTKHLCTINAIQDQSDVDNLQGNRKAPPKLMGGASSKDTIVIDSPIAAAASSIL